MYFQKRTFDMSGRPLKPDVSKLLSDESAMALGPDMGVASSDASALAPTPVCYLVVARQRRCRYQPQRAVVASHGCAVDTNREYAESRRKCAIARRERAVADSRHGRAVACRRCDVVVSRQRVDS